MAFSKYNDLRFRKPVPVKEGEEYDVEIDIGANENGVKAIDSVGYDSNR